jgi:hypothetical protein
MTVRLLYGENLEERQKSATTSDAITDLNGRPHYLVEADGKALPELI